MAVNSSITPSESDRTGRPLAIGANVALSVVLAVALVVVLNWLATMRSVRKDIATIGNLGVSERTKKIVAETPGDISISVVYAPDPRNKSQQNYIERLMDYCGDLASLSDKIKVTHVSSARQREELAAKLNKTLGGEADQHKAALADFRTFRTQLEVELARIAAQTDSILGQETWLSDFPLFAQIVLNLRDIAKDLDEAAVDIEALTPEGGIPKFAEATERAKTAVTEVQKTLEAVSKLSNELARLADNVARADSASVKMLREAADSAKSQIDSLRLTVGAPNDPFPDDVGATLKRYADAGQQVGATLEGIVKNIDALAKQFPMVRQHSRWSARVQNGPIVMQMEVADILSDIRGGLSKTRLQLLGIIDSKDPDQMSQALRVIRSETVRLDQSASACQRLLTELADRLATLDDGSAEFLRAARDGGLFKEQTEFAAKLVEKLSALPELKLGNVAGKLVEDNNVIVQVNQKLRVLEFDAVWPARETIPGSGSDDRDVARTFNGDAAVSSALLALRTDKPIAAVTFVSFEPPPPQQRNPFMPPPPQSAVPTAELSELRSRLDAANFRIYDWNLATTPERPEIEAGLNDLLIVLPPAPPAMPNPFAPQTEEPRFGDEQLEQIRKALDAGARALFVGAWEVIPAGMFERSYKTPQFGYNPLLESDWGMTLDTSKRILSIEVDNQTPDGFFVGVRKFSYMPITGFTDHPVAAPQIGTRFLVTDCVRIDRAKTPPAGVRSDVLIEVPRREDYIAVSIEQLIDIVNQINTSRDRGVVRMSQATERGPFDLMVAATRAAAGEKPESRVALLAFGASLRDRYVKSSILADTERARFESPPKESLDLVVNTMYWLNGTENFIGRGPVPVPRIRAISEQELAFARVFVWLIWPAVVFASGFVIWMFRRR
ncbi:MAG: hypothetical protein KF841_07110 [Phycisphaerae bacterium]|nr:hypothetical protein [Phycisphaerae bacterium]